MGNAIPFLSRSAWVSIAATIIIIPSALALRAQTPAPSVVDPKLTVSAIATGFSQPIAMAFLAPNDFFVTEKATGQVWRSLNNTRTMVLDLAVNFSSERGLLGIALHPAFPADPGVYLYWTESLTGADSGDLAQVPLLGNRVDRFEWNGSTLTLSTPIAALRAFQADANQPLRGNHDGGIIKFGRDGKLYIFIGDVGRRSWMQNLECGPVESCTEGTVPDDQFGGPQADAAHLTGVVLRLNDDGTTPLDNPFVGAGESIGGAAGTAIKKVFAYGFRNSIGMDFDPASDALWLQENGDDSFSEINRVDAGMNGGWVQVMGPLSRVAQFKAIETSPEFLGLQQLRWPPAFIADSPQEAEARLFTLPGARYSDPELSWKFEVAPGGVGFLSSRALGPQYQNDLFVGGATTRIEGGHLWHFNLTGNRDKIGVDDPRLEDRVADNTTKFDQTESENLLFGRNFGIVTDIRTGPNGNLFVVSLSNGTIYEIARAR